MAIYFFWSGDVSMSTEAWKEVCDSPLGAYVTGAWKWADEHPEYDAAAQMLRFQGGYDHLDPDFVVVTLAYVALRYPDVNGVLYVGGEDASEGYIKIRIGNGKVYAGRGLIGVRTTRDPKKDVDIAGAPYPGTVMPDGRPYWFDRVRP